MPYERLLVSADSDAGDSDAEESTSTANQVPVGLTGKQSGKVLASFLLSERDNSAFAKAFENGIMAWLKNEQPKYNLYPSQKILWAETIKYLAILETGLARAQSRPPPMPDFESPGASELGSCVRGIACIGRTHGRLRPCGD